MLMPMLMRRILCSQSPSAWNEQIPPHASQRQPTRCIQSDYSGSSSLELLTVGHLGLSGSCATFSISIYKSTMRARVYWPDSIDPLCLYLPPPHLSQSTKPRNSYKTRRRCLHLSGIGQNKST